ncbi:MAG: hypothetical protein ACRCUJ_00730 [Phocaeicola sp.]
MYLKRLKRIVFALGLLVLFLAYQMSLTLFTHVHVVNGFVVVHSHPSSEGHTHSAKQLTTIAHLQGFDSEEASATSFTFAIPSTFDQLMIQGTPHLLSVIPAYNYLLRAPPCLV